MFGDLNSWRGDFMDELDSEFKSIGMKAMVALFIGPV